MADLPILPGSTVVVRDNRSIYNGYKGFVQRISGVQAAVLFEGGNWDKLVTMPLKTLEQVLGFNRPDLNCDRLPGLIGLPPVPLLAAIGPSLGGLADQRS